MALCMRDRMVIAAAFALALATTSWAQLAPKRGGETVVPGVAREPGDAVDLGYRLMIGPIDGLTTGWHEAPASRAWVCAGTEVVLRQDAPADAVVLWHGEGLVARGDDGREVVCVMNEAGVQRIVAEVRTGTARQLTECEFQVVHYPHGRIIQWRSFGVEDASPRFDASWSNMDRVDAFFRGSISRLREIGDERYAVAADTWVRTRAHAWPRGFEPLLETRIDGRPTAIGARARISFQNTGEHVVEVGTPGRAPSAAIEVYDVEITSHVEGRDVVDDGIDLVFEARTEPAGYEEHITWLSSTKFGDGEPMTGTGPRFEVRFDDTFGMQDDGDGMWSWLGVRADNARFGQDQKMGCVVFDGFVHCPLGDATLQLVAGPVLEIDNIDNVGGDGVRVEFSPIAAQAWTDGTRSTFDPQLISAGERMETEMIGSNGGPTGSLGFGGLEHVGGNLLVFGDFQVLGCTDVLVEVYNGGVFQGNFIRAAGQVAVVDGGQLVAVGQTQGTLEYVLGGAQGIAPIIPIGVPLLGDEIHLSPAGCPLVRGGLRAGAIECFDLRSIFNPVLPRPVRFTGTFTQ